MLCTRYFAIYVSRTYTTCMHARHRRSRVRRADRDIDPNLHTLVTQQAPRLCRALHVLTGKDRLPPIPVSGDRTHGIKVMRAL